MKVSILCMVVIFLFSSTLMSLCEHKGAIWGSYVTYKSSSEIIVTPGSGCCNGNCWAITSDTTVDLSSVLPSSEDFVYIYIDDSASSYPTPTIIGSTTEPSFNGSNMGWYNGCNDRCIGVVWVDSNGDIIDFQNNSELEYIGKEVVIKDLLPDGGTPNGNWQEANAAGYTPVNTTAIYIYASNGDSISPDLSALVHVVAYENNFSGLVNRAGTDVKIKGWISIARGWSRKLYWKGNTDDDSNFKLKIYGFRIER